MISMNMLSLFSLSQLEHKAYNESNHLALAILAKLDKEVEEAVEEATTTNDADYSYEVFDAVQAVEWLIFESEWYKVEEKKQTKNQIVYMLKGLHEDTSPYNNQITLWKYKGCNTWNLECNAGQYGESEEFVQYYSKGFKDAQQRAVKQVIAWIKKGLEINV